MKNPMQRRQFLATAGVAVAGCAGILRAAEAPDMTPPRTGGPKRVLLVTGVDYPGHLWRKTAPARKEALEKGGRLRVRIVEDPELLAHPSLKEWDAVVLHFQNWEVPGPGAAARENLRRAVAGGTGLVLTHFACGAWFGEWPEFEKLAGRVWFGTKGGRQHDPFGKFQVEIADPEHPVTKGLKPFETEDELYTCLQGETPIHVVAKAKSKVDGKDYPMAFTLQYEKGRVFHILLGHNVPAITGSPASELFRRGGEWVAGVA
jgi:type 1 glutamine amidotransferase